MKDTEESEAPAGLNEGVMEPTKPIADYLAKHDMKIDSISLGDSGFTILVRLPNEELRTLNIGALLFEWRDSVWIERYCEIMDLASELYKCEPYGTVVIADMVK